MVQPFLPNEADAFHANQAEPDSVDFEILLLGQQRTGVISGCAVTESSPAAQTIDVALGEVVETGEQISVAVQADVAVTAADGTNPRFDLVTINGSGTVVVTAGTAAAQPVLPAIPASSVPLAALYIAASDNTHADNQINDKRVFVADRHVFNVKDFGATGDNSTDDTAAIQACFDKASGATSKAVVVIPPGKYVLTSTLTMSSTFPDIAGSGPFGTRLVWNAAGGTCLSGAPGASSLRGIHFIEGTGKPDIWLDYAADTEWDYGETIDDCFFDDWNDTTGIAAIRTGKLLNGHMRNIRFGGGKGFAIILKATGGGAFVLENFTVDSQNTTAGVMNGFINLHKTAQGTMQLRLANGRIENSSVAWTNPSGIIWIDSDPINNLGTIPLNATLDNLDLSADGTGLVSLIYQDTTQTGVGSNVLLTSVGFAGDNICGGNWSSAVEKPERPSGAYGLLAIGRFNSGAPENRRTNWWMQSLQLGEYLSMKEAITAPAAEGGSFARIYIPSDLDPKVKFADGTTKELIPKALETAGSPTLAWDDSIVNIEATASVRTVTLPDNAAFDGKGYLIRRDGANTVTIDRAGSDTFDDADIQKTLDSDGAAIGIFSIGDGEWKIVGTEGTVGGS